MNAKILPIKRPKSNRIWIRVSGNLILNQETGMYYVRKFRAGKGRLFQSTGFTQKGKAQSKADEMVAEWLYGKRATTGRAQRVEEAVDLMMEEIEKEFFNKDRKETHIGMRKSTRSK